METEITEPSRFDSIAGALILMAATIVVVVMIVFITNYVLDLSEYIMKPINHFLTTHGMCSHGYEQQCHQTPLKH
jgi:hypothetical protein